MSHVQILHYLQSVANQNLWLNALNHLIALAAIVFIFLGKNAKPKRILVDGAMVVLTLSVSITGLKYGNPVHTLTFAVIAVFALIELMQGKNDFTIRKTDFQTVLALFFLFIGFWYPEFVKTNFVGSLLFSPAGIIPCPTLLIILGLLTLAFPNVNKVQYIITLIMGVFYGFVGVFQLKVYLDITLIVIVICAIFWYFKTPIQRQRTEQGVSNH